MDSLIDGVILSELKIITGENGSVMHGLKTSDPSFTGFGEAYFSTIKNGAVKGWKKHTQMTLNIIVPSGCIRFVLFDDRKSSRTEGEFNDIKLGPEHKYYRLTVPPGIWMAFQGCTEGLNLLLNVANIPHDPTEAEQLPIINNTIPQINW